VRVALVGVVVALALPGVARAYCSVDEHAAAVAKADAYAKAMPAAKQRWFKTHKRKAPRDAFVARQYAELGRLRDVAGCVVLDPTPKFRFGIGVSDAEQQEVRDDVAYDLRQLRAMTGVTLQGPTIYVSRDAQQLAEWAVAQYRLPLSAVAVKRAQYESLGITAEAGDHGVVVVAFTPSWERASAAGRLKILAHELFHHVQQELQGNQSSWGTTPESQVRPNGPVWLNEGSAEWMGYQVAAAAGVYSYSSSLAGYIAQAKATDVPLQAFETYAGIHATPIAYGWLFAACDLLASRAGGLPSFLDYWRRIAAGTPWRDAFQQAFGRSVDQFYAEFAAYRATL
jgi:hypothetical protein